MSRWRHPLRPQEHVEQGRYSVCQLQVQFGAVGGTHASADLLSAHERQRPNTVKRGNTNGIQYALRVVSTQVVEQCGTARYQTTTMPWS